jgi:hypothetical protein
MLILTRERLNQQLQQVGRLVDLYQAHDSNFIEQVVRWLSKIEEHLQQMRNPLSSYVAAERARILAAHDGFRDPHVSDPKVTRRKAIMATTSLVLNSVVDRLVETIRQIDEKFDAWREKMTQLLALGSMKKPIPMPPTEPRQLWLNKVWSQLGEIDEARGMYVYLNATMTQSDRLQLLDELIVNMIGSQPAQQGIAPAEKPVTKQKATEHLTNVDV